MNSSENPAARLDEWRQRSRQVAETFAAEMERLTTEVTRQPAVVVIRADERGGVAGVEVEPAAFGRAAPTALAAATASALALAGISAMPDFSAQARRVMTMLDQGVTATAALSDVTDDLAPTDFERHQFEEMAIDVDGRGAFAVVIDLEWLKRSTAAEYAMAVKENVNAVLARRAATGGREHG